VILQVALVLHETNKPKTQKALQFGIATQSIFKNPIVAFCNILLVSHWIKVENYATSRSRGGSPEFWPDELWHALAAQVNIKTSEISSAANHLSSSRRA
jgi:hypothetical protein